MAAKPMLRIALEICEKHEAELTELLARILLGLAKFGSWETCPCNKYMTTQYAITRYASNWMMEALKKQRTYFFCRIKPRHGLYASWRL